MLKPYHSQLPDTDPSETLEWREALTDVVQENGAARANYLLQAVSQQAASLDVGYPRVTHTPYINTIAPQDQAAFPGDMDMERKIRRIIRWNAMAMVVRANKKFNGIGGHLSSYASSAHLYEIGFNHFFKGGTHADQVFVQGHSTPGIYARAFLEGRLTADQLDHFRREVEGKGLSSYPHPWLMPDFWQFPTVSMGLGPIAAIYQARFNKYLHARGLADTSAQRVWAFLGDGECDEPESLGALTVAAREGLNNLVFVVNCNLQRLDGPVRGNGKIIQELEGLFTGAGWDVIKLIWNSEWDRLIPRDTEGFLQKRLMETVDGQYQKYSVSPGSFLREDFFGAYEPLAHMVQDWSDEDLRRLGRGGHDVHKVYAAYHAAVTQQQRPVVILAKTVKGWGLGGSFAATNTTHQMKKMEASEMRAFRDRMQLPISDSALEEIPFYHPGEKSPEVTYLLEKRHALGGFVPSRKRSQVALPAPEDKTYAEFFQGGKPGIEVSTTMAFVRLLRNLMRDNNLGKHIVPIVPDEGRTFGMDAFFREFGIYAHAGQKYTPIDANMLLHYHEAKDGQLLEEGITEAGSMASFLAASTAYATHGVNTVPFYIFYSMFGFQRTADQIWSVGDSRGRGFLLGATAGRTTLNGEGLQHEDGHSHLFAQAVPNCLAYDPAFAFETSVIIRDGLKRMLEQNEDVFYYITLYNENYVMPAMPEGAEEGILKGLYCYQRSTAGKHKAHLFASGPMVMAALEAQKILANDYDVAADVWSVTSYQQLYRDARATERFNRLHPEQKPRLAYVQKALVKEKGPVVCVSDWVQEIPSLLGRFMPQRFLPLGTNGFGRSDTREALRAHFEVDVAHTITTVLYGLMLDGHVDGKTVSKAMKKYGIDPQKSDPMGL
jgi:pyruvate dehydrogenase E1 component